MKTLLSQNSLVFNPPMLGCVILLSGLPGSGSKIYDRSPYGNIGTITGATWKRLPSGLWCLDFDGTDDFVEIAYNEGLNVDGHFTVKTWFNAEVFTQNNFYPALVSRMLGNSGFTLEKTNNALTFSLWLGDGVDIQGSATTTSIQTDTWYQIVAVYDGQIKMYLNGIVEGTPATQDPPAQYTGVTKIGLHSSLTAAQRYWNGLIACPAIIRRAWSALEVQNNFNREKHLFGVW